MKSQTCQECEAKLMPELTHCPACGAESATSEPVDLRCECGFLLCKLGFEALEIKCRRCKRLVYVPVDGLPERFEKLKQRVVERRSQKGPKPNSHADGKGQYCPACGEYKQGVVYGKCLDCRTRSIKVQYKSRSR